MELKELGMRAKSAKYEVALLDTETKNELLHKIADAILADAETIIRQNAIDMENGRKNNRNRVPIMRKTVMTSARVRLYFFVMFFFMAQSRVK